MCIMFGIDQACVEKIVGGLNSKDKKDIIRTKYVCIFYSTGLSWGRNRDGTDQFIVQNDFIEFFYYFISKTSITIDFSNNKQRFLKSKKIRKL